MQSLPEGLECWSGGTVLLGVGSMCFGLFCPVPLAGSSFLCLPCVALSLDLLFWSSTQALLALGLWNGHSKARAKPGRFPLLIFPHGGQMLLCALRHSWSG